MNAKDKLRQAYEEFDRTNYGVASDLFAEAIELQPSLLQSGVGVALAHSLILSLDWEKVTNYLPPNSNIFDASGWLKSLASEKPVDSLSQPIPWYTYPAIEFIEDKIKSDFKVFEYGSGHSTLWWANKVQEIVSIESNKNWHNYLKSSLTKLEKSENINLYLSEEAQDYIQKINEFPPHYFDVIIVDGEHRPECAKEAYLRLKENGFIILDDTDREYYDDILRFLDQEGFFRIDFVGMTPSLVYKNSTSILFKDINFLKNNITPSQKESCLGKSFFQPDEEQNLYFDDLEHLYLFD
ncbi:class I SAM-dependent methyltransferase [Geminocystis herdmanii]|uniref:class I SAM-dependent methyltransferase n=1 Tax=Geminocystis herdmanii TaxID=669359 RepID=UPI00034CEF5A|nr:class I SAM-dependent methyltransferase [Geminocystis herdmanii]